MPSDFIVILPDRFVMLM